MSQTEIICIVIWILGMLFNALIAKKFFQEDKDVDPLTALLLLPLMMIQELAKMVFILGSWVTWLAIGITFILDKIKEWLNTSIRKKTE